MRKKTEVMVRETEKNYNTIWLLKLNFNPQESILNSKNRFNHQELMVFYIKLFELDNFKISFEVIERDKTLMNKKKKIVIEQNTFYLLKFNFNLVK